MLNILEWLGYILLYLTNPDEVASHLLDTQHFSWWSHELILFAHHAVGVVGLEAIVVIICRRHPWLIMPFWRLARGLWFRMRQSIRWIGKRFRQNVRTVRLARRPQVPGNGKRVTVADIFWTAATPIVAKFATVAMILQWKEYGWRGFLAAWLGGSLRIVAYPFIGNWVYLIIAVYAVIRWRRYIWWFFLWLRSLFARMVL